MTLSKEEKAKIKALRKQAEDKKLYGISVTIATELGAREDLVHTFDAFEERFAIQYISGRHISDRSSIYVRFEGDTVLEIHYDTSETRKHEIDCYVPGKWELLLARYHLLAKEKMVKDMKDLRAALDNDKRRCFGLPERPRRLHKLRVVKKPLVCPVCENKQVFTEGIKTKSLIPFDSHRCDNCGYVLTERVRKDPSVHPKWKVLPPKNENEIRVEVSEPLVLDEADSKLFLEELRNLKYDDDAIEFFKQSQEVYEKISKGEFHIDIDVDGEHYPTNIFADKKTFKPVFTLAPDLKINKGDKVEMKICTKPPEERASEP